MTRRFRPSCLAAALCLLPAAAPAQWGESTRVTDPAVHARKDAGGYPYREKADYVLKELDLRPGDTVVDIGAGDGFWAERMAAAVGPQGVVHAAEVDQKLVDKLKERFAARPQVQPCLCTTDGLPLPERSCDLAFLSQTYHHLDAKGRVEYLRRLSKVVKPDGRLCIVEKYPVIATHQNTHGTQLSTLLREAEEAGWVPVRSQLMAGTYHYLAVFVQKGLFPAQPQPPKK